jgi:hypothetical protein
MNYSWEHVSKFPPACALCLRGWRSYQKLERDPYLVSKNELAQHKANRENAPYTEIDMMVRNDYTGRCNCALGRALEAEYQTHQQGRR